ncbi:hypothetical protein [Bradyrhizobium sp. 195]|uniref:hypothetical protein n=1 Tax=Bradyrhizobium sp. 195 TaxID=2782662 RepID=UPI002001599D|nr:hypothetical protein [Bradyrhizobium sp. 195]UPK27663.1 hypothetical protein IVB26_03360 [Bradyrhizobium sp. 195]
MPDQVRNPVQHKLVGDVKAATDALAIRGEDLRQLPMTMRKTKLAELLRAPADGMFIAPFEADAVGPEFRRLPRWASGSGLEVARPPL